MAHWYRPVMVVLLLAFIVSACSVKRVNRTLVSPRHHTTLDHKSPYLKVHLKNGGMLVLSQWEVKESEQIVAGFGAAYDVRREGGGDRFRSAPLDSVALFETNVTEVSPSVAALTVFSGISVGVSIYCISNPKACFGSCPTFYLSDGEDEMLMAEGFSASIAPSLEATDLDALARARPGKKRLEVAMLNEALETHVVRHVDLLGVPRPPRGRVFATPDGVFWRARDLSAPVSATGPEGSFLPAVLEADGVERYSTADSTNLAARETLDLTFDAAGIGPCGLVIGSRQTLLSTYLFYQTLAYMGSQAGTWLAMLERQAAGGKGRFSGMGNALGGIEVWVQRGGQWLRAGEIQEHGPLAVDQVLVPLPEVQEQTLRVQLRMTRGKHRLDYVTLTDLEGTAKPTRIPPIAVHRGGKTGVRGQPDAGALARLTDPRRTLVTLPGDRYTLVYDLPAASVETPGEGEGQGVDEGEGEVAWDLFLESRGYYLEWIRDEWIREEDPASVAEVLFFPKRALVRLAPGFKAMEAEMDEIFWGSKYAGR